MFRHHHHQYRRANHDVIELCSSFYTSNPLLYFSHYAEIIVATAGQDVGMQRPATPPPPQGPRRCEGRVDLAERREVVELLDAEPLFDYLVQNGVMKADTISALQGETSPVKTNLAVLQCVQDQDKSHLGLFVNALRQTGQHYLANLLDDTARIKAGPEGGNSQRKHKGEVSIHVQVSAVQLQPDAVSEGEHPWVSLDDVELRVADLSRPSSCYSSMARTHKSSVQQMEVAEPERENGRKKKRTCLCSCFSNLFTRSKSKKGGSDAPVKAAKVETVARLSGNGKPKQMEYGNVQIMEATNGDQLSFASSNGHQFKVLATNVDTASSVPNLGLSSESTRTSVNNLRNVANTLQKTSEEFQETLCEQSSPAHTTLLKYFEQSRGVLVMECNCDEGLVVVGICMKLDQVQSLERDLASGKLTSDLQALLVTDDLLHQLGAKGIRLQVSIDKEELQMAEEDLTP